MKHARLSQEYSESLEWLLRHLYVDQQLSPAGIAKYMTLHRYNPSRCGWPPSGIVRIEQVVRLLVKIGLYERVPLQKEIDN